MLTPLYKEKVQMPLLGITPVAFQMIHVLFIQWSDQFCDVKGAGCFGHCSTDEPEIK